METIDFEFHFPLYTILKKVQGPQINTIVHVGAHLGQEINLYQDLNPRRVVWIEGDPDIVPRLKETIRNHGNGKTQHVVINALVTDRENDTAALRRFNNEGLSSSIFPPTALLHETFAGIDETGEVHRATTRTLESLLRENGVTPEEVTAVVVDIQGAELLCLRGMGPYLDAVPFLEVEISTLPIYDGAPSFEALDGYLKEQGFRAISPVRPHGNMVYVNPRFVKNESELPPPSEAPVDAPQEVNAKLFLPPLRLYNLLRHHHRMTVDTLVHVGAHYGQELEPYEELGTRRVIWIEGDPAVFPLLVERLQTASNGNTEHVAVNAVITDKDGDQVVLNRFNNFGQSTSLFRSTELKRAMYPGVAETGDQVEVPSRTLQAVLRELDVTPRQLSGLIVDIQGAELLCLRGAGPYLDHVALLEVEMSRVPVYEGAPLFEEVNAFLEAKGFRAITPVLDHGDVLYIHPDRIRLSPEAMDAMAQMIPS